jgi:hypothetical protein
LFFLPNEVPGRIADVIVEAIKIGSGHGAATMEPT